MTTSPTQRQIVIVTGMAGAGLSTARTAFEDIGFEAIDNVPLDFIEALLARPDRKALALGIDVRTRGFSAPSIIDLLDRLSTEPDTKAQLVFLDCDDQQLLGRFSETRRHHPLAGPDRSVADGLSAERQLLAPLKSRADLAIDTTAMSTTELRHLLHGYFSTDSHRGLSVHVQSFSFRYGVPRDADLVIDARFLRNPHYVADLKPLTGQSEPVGHYIAEDPAFAPFFNGLTQSLSAMLPGFCNNDRPYLTIAFGCTGGKHRSVYLAERMAGWMRTQSLPVRITHRELERNGLLASPAATLQPTAAP